MSMPDSALGGDPFTNQMLISGKAMLGRDLFRLKRYQQMDDLADDLPRPPRQAASSTTTRTRTATIRNQLRFELVDVKLFARYGLADAAYQAGDYARVVELLEPLVDAAAGPPTARRRPTSRRTSSSARPC